MHRYNFNKKMSFYFPSPIKRWACFLVLRCPLPLAFQVCLSLFFSAVSQASPPPSSDVHFCRVLGAEDMCARDSIYAATKQALNLNVGEPRTVRMIYFLPNDRPFQQEVVDSMKVTIRQIQTFYAEQIQAHGYGNKTFRFETDAQGEPMVHRVDGQYPTDRYSSIGSMKIEITQKFDLSANIYLWVIDNGRNSVGFFGSPVGGVTNISRSGSRITSSIALVPSEFHWVTVAHELGHTFQLRHDFNDGAYLMSYGPGQDRLSAFSAGFLAVHPYFNPDIEMIETQPSTIELISPPGYLGGSKSVPVQLKISDSDGLHQVFLILKEEVKTCQGLKGEKDAIVEFNYDGIIPSDDNTSLSNADVHLINIEVVDTFGNISSKYFVLWDISKPGNIVALLEGHTDGIWSVAFSPDGTTLASGSQDRMVKLWDVATGENIATLEGHWSVVRSVAFSPDGTILASGSRDRMVKLWDVATGENIATLEGHDRVHSIAFSPDGRMLASGYYDQTVKLWDVETKEIIATLEGHATNKLFSVAFSPDGTTLAIGSEQGNIMWDIATQNFVTLEGQTGLVWSVAFSPDGTLLASSGWNVVTGNTVKLWDVSTKRHITTFGRKTNEFVSANEIFSVAFSRDGMILASGIADEVILWDVATERKITTLKGHKRAVHSVEFSPDGTILATAADDNRILLRDMSAYVTPVVTIPDANLRAVIRDALDKSRFAPITVTDMARLTTLDASNRDIRDLTGLEFATNLIELNLTDNPLSSLSISTHIPSLQGRGVEVLFARSPTADFDGDGTVNLADFLLFATQFGLSRGDAGYDARFDLDGNGTIGIKDFLIFVNAFGE